MATASDDTARIERRQGTPWRLRERFSIDGRGYAVLSAPIEGRLEWRLVDATVADEDHIGTLQFPDQGGATLTLYREHVSLAVLQRFFRCATGA